MWRDDRATFKSHRSVTVAAEMMSSRTPLRLFLAWTWVDVAGDMEPWESSGLKEQNKKKSLLQMFIWLLKFKNITLELKKQTILLI